MCKNIFRQAGMVLGVLVCAAVMAVALGGTNPLYGQQPANGGYATQRLAIFVDCGRCPRTFIRQEMTYVDYVRDRERADVHVLVTRQNTGGGGTAHTFDLIGLGPFAGEDYSTVYATSAGDTDDQERRGFLRTLQVALMPYLVQTPMAQRISLVVEQDQDDSGEQQTEDPWNGWTFEIYGNGFGNMESSQYDIRLRYGVDVEHVSEDWKVRLRPYFNYAFDKFERNDETITSTSRRDGFDSYLIRSISDHWSVGFFGDVFTSTFSNIDLRFRLRPAVEYSVFPYRESTRRQLTFAYLLGGTHVQYDDTTIFGQKEEMLVEHAFDAEYEVTQPWGEIDVGMQASQYFHDASKYRVEFGGRVEIRVTQGLSVDFGGSAELIHDQLNLPKGDASLEETLLRRRQLATNFEISGRMGFRYRFGSIYNNVVNPRF